MATRTSQAFHGTLTNIQCDNCISNLYAQVQALETEVGELSKASTNPNNESFSASVPQPQRL